MQDSRAVIIAARAAVADELSDQLIQWTTGNR